MILSAKEKVAFVCILGLVVLVSIISIYFVPKRAAEIISAFTALLTASYVLFTWGLLRRLLNQ